jgi:D-methionine transport system permease protein
VFDHGILLEYWGLLSAGIIDTLYMVFLSTFFSYLFGLPLGIALVISEERHILPNRPLNMILGWIVNIGRSLPFIILLIAIIPFTRLVVGTTIGATASIVPLTIGAIPFVARMVETSMKEIDSGVIEAAQSMGASPWQIIASVMLPETMPSLILGLSITTITLVGYSAMAGAVGGGGLGDLAIRYGYYRYEKDIMLITIVLLVILVQLIQSAGSGLAFRIDKRHR